jgi:hypothetical protein
MFVIGQPMIGWAAAIQNNRLKRFEIARLIAPIGVTLRAAAQAVSCDRDHVAGKIIQRVTSEHCLQAGARHFAAQGLPLIGGPSRNEALGGG